MNFSCAEEAIKEIYEFLRIRNGLLQFDYTQASQKPENIKYEMLPEDAFEKEQNKFKNVILPSINSKGYS